MKQAGEWRPPRRRKDFERILTETEPASNMLRQQEALLLTEGINLQARRRLAFTPMHTVVHIQMFTGACRRRTFTTEAAVAEA